MYVWSFVSTYVTSLVAQMVKNLPAIREIWIWPLGGKILWSRKWHPPQYSCLENPMDRGAWWATVYGDTESWTWVSISFSLSRRFLVVVLICISIIFQDVEAFHVIFKRTMWVKLTSGDWPLDPLHCFEFFFQDLPEDICWRKMIFFFLHPHSLVRTCPSAQVFLLLLQNRKVVAFLHAPLVVFVSGFGNWCPRHYRRLECKSRKSRNTWSNR